MFNRYPYTNFHDLNLDWMLEEMTNIAQDINELLEWKEARSERDAYYDAKIDELTAEYERLSALYDDFVREVNAQFAALSTEITDQVNALETRVTDQVNALEEDVYARLAATQQQLAAEMSQFKSEVRDILSVYNVRIQAVEQGLDDIIDQLPDMFTIIDPYTGEENSIVNVIYEIVNRSKTNSLTAAAYDDAALTAAAYDALNITAYNYDFNGADYIGA